MSLTPKQIAWNKHKEEKRAEAKRKQAWVKGRKELIRAGQLRKTPVEQVVKYDAVGGRRAVRNAGRELRAVYRRSARGG